jgi:hypothetical protein
MNIYKIYNDIIQRAQQRTLEKTIYTEKHHINPKCLIGYDDYCTVKLTAKEHFVCHHLLTKMYPENSKLHYAFWAMCNQKALGRNYKLTSKIYAIAKENHSKHMSKLFSGIPLTEKTKQKMCKPRNNTENMKNPKSESHKINNGLSRRKYTPTTKVCPYCEKEWLASLYSDFSKKYCSSSCYFSSKKGKPVILSSESRQKVTAKLKNRKQSEETVQARIKKLEKTYMITKPNGEILCIKGLIQFCKENQLTPGLMRAVANNKQTHHKGWKCCIWRE